MANKVAVVTGAGSGIGKASALALLNAGYSVALAGRRAELLNQAVSESGAGARALAVPTDVSKPEDVPRCSHRPSRSSAASTCSSTTRAPARPACCSRT